jgi:hypothetical protein
MARLHFHIGGSLRGEPPTDTEPISPLGRYDELEGNAAAYLKSVLGEVARVRIRLVAHNRDIKRSSGCERNSTEHNGPIRPWSIQRIGLI